MRRPGRRRSAVLAVVALAAVVSPPAANAVAVAAPARAAGKTVTLVTGDRVTLTGRDDVRVRPAPGREHVGFEQRIDENGHSVVVPHDVAALVAGGQLDPRLFDVSALVEAGYHDEARRDLPLVVTRTGATAIRPAKDALSSVWAALDAGGGTTLSPGVRRVALDGPVHVDLDHSVPQIGAPQAWQAGYTGRGTTVAVLDTGIDATHPDLADAVAGTRDFTGSPGGSDDRTGHGTHVASIITGSGAASDGRFRGVAPDTRLLVGKVLDDHGDGTESSVVEGMEWAVAQGADVIAMSLSGSVAGGKDPGVDLLSEAVNRLTAQSGALFVVSAGNRGPRAGSVGSPGVADAALTVGAVDGDDAPAEFSGRGPRAGDGAIKPDLTAPGVGIVAARAKNGSLGTPVDAGYTAMSGTSMSAPHVAGAAAILAGMHPDWDAALLKAALMGSAAPRDGLTVYEQGAGRVDVARAVGQPVLATPASVSLGEARWPHEDDAPIPTVLTYRNTGTTPVTLDLAVAVRDAAGNPAPAGMFTVAPRTLEVPAGGQATATLTADTAVDGPDGTYGGTVVATGGGNVVRTPLGLQREAERHDVELGFRDWHGNPAQLADYRFVGLDQPSAYLATVTTGSAVVRLPPGRYFFHATVLGRNAGNELIRALFAEPEITVTGDTRMAIDARDAQPVGMRVDRPDAGDSETIQSFLRTTSSGETGFRTFGSFDKVWVRPSATSAPGFTFTAEGLFARRDGQGGFTGSPYLYHLRWAERGRVPAELVRHFADRDLATVRSTHAASGSGETGERDYTVRAPLPFTLQEFYSPGTPWERFLGKPAEKPLYEWSTQAVPRTFRRGESVAEHWNSGVLGPAFPPYPGSPAEWAGRTGDTVHFDLSPFSDPSSGHYGQSVTESAETVLYRGDERIGSRPWVGYHEFDVPPGESPYRLHSEAERSGSAELSTKVVADWTFRSGTVPGTRVRPVPMMAVRFTPRLDDRNRAPSGVPFLVPVRVEHTDEHARITSLTVRVSYDDGGTWQAVPVLRSGGEWLAGLRHPAGAAFVSLRATATDGAGDTVDQTIIRGYRLK
ncbi:S8 family peptidase [Amycolatopsis sp. Hca4]|uniref:S8 family peptidase n=1 Tax=Amycolatopsis sp. Hca4 TaxID=2742131 RepID=UPI00158FFBF2|nr:S8 family peptidase [Amycolatopsis sp. Hca4]QKV80332.1 S8 family peptidase [Amycolatopsis sp. Hca4]